LLPSSTEKGTLQEKLHCQRRGEENSKEPSPQRKTKTQEIPKPILSKQRKKKGGSRFAFHYKEAVLDFEEGEPLPFHRKERDRN